MRHKILENLKDTEHGKGYTSAEIAEICLKNNFVNKRTSIFQKVTILKNEALLCSEKPWATSGVLLHRISPIGLRVLKSYDDLYSGKRESGTVEDYDTLGINEAYYLKGIENYVFNEDRWLFASEVAEFFDVSKRGIIASKLNTLCDLGFIEKKMHDDERFVYKTKKITVFNNESGEEDVSQSDITESELTTLIEDFLYNKRKWVTIEEIRDFLQIPKNRSIMKILRDLRSKGAIYLVNHLNTSGRVIEFPIAKSTRLFIEDTETETSEEIALKARIDYLLNVGIDPTLIDITCCKALKELLHEEKDKKRKLELEILKEKNFLLLEDFNQMKVKVARLKKELGGE